MMIDGKYRHIPEDWQSPDWQHKDRVHEWKNYVTKEVEKIWDTLPDNAKMVFAESYQEVANKEEWE